MVYRHLFMAGLLAGSVAASASAETHDQDGAAQETRSGQDSASMSAIDAPSYYEREPYDGEGGGTSGDDLGNHTAVTGLDMGGYRVMNIPMPEEDGDAASKEYVDGVVATATGDNMGDHNATQNLDMRGNRINMRGARIQMQGGDLDLDGGEVYGSNGYYYTSDRRLKENIRELEGMSIIRALDGVGFDWRESGDHAWGMIAQDVRKVAPHMVREDDAGMLSVDYTQTIAPLIEAIQQLDARVTELEARLQ